MFSISQLAFHLILIFNVNTSSNCAMAKNVRFSYAILKVVVWNCTLTSTCTFCAAKSWNGRSDNFIEHYFLHFLHFNLSRFFFASQKMCVMMLISIFFSIVFRAHDTFANSKIQKRNMNKTMVSSVDYILLFRQGIMMNLFLVSRFLCVLCIFNMDELVVFSSSSSIPVRKNTQKSIFFNSSCFTLSPTKIAVWCIHIFAE